ncbi:suppressor of fused domain protein [Actinocorallia sp. B10E7]|uniref:suppressor of fused domain protein n=1 Tax=Actinocorallia sp. B10E7 TaxID=3153558 RepID=UPI00325ED4CC
MDGIECDEEAISAVADHVGGFFAGHEVDSTLYDLGRSRRAAVPGLRILTVAPGPRADGWTYVTAGCWGAANEEGQGLELVLSAPGRDEGFVELLAMVAYYHATRWLELRHSVPIGRPWAPGSSCDHLLVSRPRLHGPAFEYCSLPGGRARLLEIVPVTAAELAFRREHGHEALERLFEETGTVPTDPHRPCAVA